MASLPTPYIPLQEYIEGEERSEVLHEYYRGELFPIEAATLRHQDIAADLFTALQSQLQEKPCRVRFHGTRVSTGADGLYAYPDIVIVCGATQVAPNDPNAITNPKVIIEILSPSTKDYDRGTKFELYSTIPSLTEYVVVHQDQVLIEHRVKQPDGWFLRFLRGMESTLQLETLLVSIPFSKIYPAAD